LVNTTFFPGSNQAGLDLVCFVSLWQWHVLLQPCEGRKNSADVYFDHLFSNQTKPSQGQFQ
jgi:hypothetical protein